MFEIVTEQIINAPVTAVWQTLIDFNAYQDWNPFIIKASRNNEKLFITTKPANSNPMSFSPEIITLIKNQELRWRGEMVTSCVLKAEHYFLLQDLGNQQTRLIQGEKFSGALTYVMTKVQQDNIRSGFNAMNLAVAARVNQCKMQHKF